MANLKSRALSGAANHLDPRLVRADEDEKERREDGDERDDADAGHLLRDFIADSHKFMDGLSKRMDALEGRHRDDGDEDEEKEKKEKKEKKEDSHRKDGDEDEDEDKEKKEDSHRKDGDEDEEDEGKAKEVVADRRKRKDNDEDRSEEKSRQDAKRRDEDAHADAVTPAQLKELQRMFSSIQGRIGDLERVMPKHLTDEDHAALADAQARADAAFTAIGKRAPGPLRNEDVESYERRTVRLLKEHSPTYKDANVMADAVADKTVFAAIRDKVYADAIAAGRAALALEPGQLRMRERRTAGGHTVREFDGASGTWMQPMTGPVTSYVKAFADA